MVKIKYKPTGSPPYSLREKRVAFSYLITLLIDHAFKKGYEVAVGEVVRSREQAKRNAAKGIGTKNSLHIIGLAVDLNLYKNGKYIRDGEKHRFLGEFWESLSYDGIQCCWGGRFGDANHYSVFHGGRK